MRESIRKEVRVHVTLRKQDGSVHHACAIDISASGAALATIADFNLTDIVDMRLEGGMKLKALVTRVFESGIGVKFLTSDSFRTRMDSILDEIPDQAHRTTRLERVDRAGERHKTRNTSIIITSSRGAHRARLLNVSWTGVAIVSTKKLEIGDLVEIGGRQGTVARVDGMVAGIKFKCPIVPSELDEWVASLGEAAA
ncbi:MAG: PilZ domain-containing protein [Pseudomonadota bacterium]